MDTKRAAFEAIEKELIKARKKFPSWPTDPVHAAAIVAEESGELTRAALQFTYEKGPGIDMFDEAIQVGAMAVRFIENMLAYEERQSIQATGA